jgi:hypothetical protein
MPCSSLITFEIVLRTEVAAKSLDSSKGSLSAKEHVFLQGFCNLVLDIALWGPTLRTLFYLAFVALTMDATKPAAGTRIQVLSLLQTKTLIVEIIDRTG